MTAAAKETAAKLHPEHIRFAVLATDVVVFRVRNGNLQVLLRKVEGNPHYPDNWSLIGGLILPSETAEDSVDRHLSQKAGLKGIYKEQLETFSDVDRDPRGRVVSVAYIALVNEDQAEAGGTKDGKTRWCGIRQVPILAYDHNLILLAAIQRLQAKIFYTNIARHVLPKHFTMKELRTAYEAMMENFTAKSAERTDIDPSNFRIRMKRMNMLKETRQVRAEGPHRPATLFAFKHPDTRITVSL